MKGLDGIQGPVYVGTGTVFNRQALYGYDPPVSEKRPKMTCDCWPSWCCCCCGGSRKSKSKKKSGKGLFSVFSKNKNKKKMMGKDYVRKGSGSMFDLPYWSDLDVIHCIDDMHVEKNVRFLIFKARQRMV